MSGARLALLLLAALGAGFVGGNLSSRSWWTLPADNMFAGCMIHFMRGQPSTMQATVETHCAQTHGPK